MPDNINTIARVVVVATLILAAIVWYFLYAWRLRGSVRHPLHGFRVTIPDGWRGRFRWDYIEFKPPGQRWPNMEVELVGFVRDGSIDRTKEFIQYHVQKWRATILGERQITVEGLPAVEVSYRHPEDFGGKEFCRVSVIRDNIEYLIQISTESLAHDRALFDGCVQSFRFC